MIHWNTPSFGKNEDFFPNTKKEGLNISPEVFNLPEFKLITDESIEERFKLKEELMLNMSYDKFIKESKKLTETEIIFIIDLIKNDEKLRKKFIKENNFLIDKEKNPKAYEILKEAKKIEYNIEYYDIYKILDKYDLNLEDKFDFIEKLKGSDDIIIVNDTTLEKYKSLSKNKIKGEDIKKIIDIYFDLLGKETTKQKRKLINSTYKGTYTYNLSSQNKIWLYTDSIDYYKERERKIKQAKNFNKKLSIREIQNIRKRKEDREKIKDIKNFNNSNGFTIKNTISGKNDNTYISNIYEKKGGYTLTTDYGTIDGITEDEYNTIGIKEKNGEIITENPEILKNLINFHKFFKDLNLLGVWKYRKDLIKAIGDIDINLEDDSLKKSELIRFGNKLIDFINNLENSKVKGEDWFSSEDDPYSKENKDKLQKSNSIYTLKEELRSFSGANSPLSENKTFNIYGEGNFVANLRSFGIIGGACFHIMQFRDILNGKNISKKSE